METKIYLKYINNYVVDYYKKHREFPNAMIISECLHSELLKEGTYNICEELFGIRFIVSYHIDETIALVI